MTEIIISCPNCSHRFAISEALSAKLEHEIETRLQSEHGAQLQRAVTQARASVQEKSAMEVADLKAQLAERATSVERMQAEELALRHKARQLEEENRTLAERVRGEVEEQLRKEEDARINAAVIRMEAKIRTQSEQELQLLQNQLASQQQRLNQAQSAELMLRKEKTAMEERQRELDLEVARKLDEEKQRLDASIRKAVNEEQVLKLKEKDKLIEGLRDALENAHRKSQQGSQETQGEVLELDLESVLIAKFPGDEIKAVKNGVRGADLIQVVRNNALQPCGTIVWEAKNAKNWSSAWIAKLKDDQRAARAGLAVLVSTTLPAAIRGFGCLDGVWVSDLASYPALAIALREQLIEVVRARVVSTGVNAKMELLYGYLSGHEFRNRIEAIVEAFTAMQAQIARERRAMEKQWAERAKQVERVISSTAGMYGALSGIVDQSLPAIHALELEGPELLEGHDVPNHRLAGQHEEHGDYHSLESVR
ncbi:hypothetical protein B1B_01337 [mine drainage metagenome]|uniref:DUF2130 domain-containing protein n=1 Tax=mine drainage metagenome TaxID=410659 RepID=T1C4N1_9ZZZZ